MIPEILVICCKSLQFTLQKDKYKKVMALHNNKLHPTV